jgi:hypothetical protein
MMKPLVLLGVSLLFVFFLRAQLPEDALRMSYFRPSGTAREQAIGGAMGSLGGDISANFVNPAGLAFYKTGEILVTPGWAFSNNNSSYLSANTKSPAVNNFNLGASGLVYGWSSDPNSSSAISLAVNRSANFNGHISYQGNNNYSSGADAYVEEFNNSGLTVDQALSNPGVSYGTRMALYTYLIDTSNGGTIAQPDKVLAAGGQLNQRTDITTSGGITEIALGIAGASHDKWYYGLSLGFPIVNYQQTTRYTETDAGGNSSNDFGSYTYTESYSSKGVGVNARLGVIFRPTVNWRIGLAVHTPSFYSLTDKVSASMKANTEGYHGTDSIESAVLDQAAGSGNSIDYNLQAPWHLLISGSYIFTGGGTDGKMGFITGDIELVTNKSSRFSLPTDDNGNSPDDSYYDPLNSVVKSYYKSNYNFRLGGEYKINEVALRLGGSYSTDPYSSSDLKANRTTLSGGIGYRKKGIFIDLTYVEAIQNDVNFPYRLAEKESAFAMVKQYTGNILLTLGFKF